ncbi:Paf1-domain-containing protein [Cryphonectria parasitica EP155]|uniref:Paf1-domain-containing protein n=1 Tax=Cryphonectria parasitica (strain ATCC 38755 / EP155) TaxID=660469 RepID=A0A9P5CU48_CRYP1|nr:Paf1-domain-containing protein [Cryphonectria parasitica EP155]KAF3770121.1 Paf1-domain-containing protein [Cryphonectria parasitica EP155]
MSSQPSRNGERGYHQDFIARIRYSNALPPPPNPPKLLDIPNTGLASGQYTTPGFASRLAREQPLNIEADAELGMPIDLVGMPGVFDGDEHSIQAPDVPPPVHPHDRVLLRPLATLGKPQVSGTSVSFLRRTEYISNANTNKASPFRQIPRNNVQRPPKRKSPEPEAGTPAAIKRRIEKGFDAAQVNLKDQSRVRHPTKPLNSRNKGLRVVEAFPVLPDLEAFPDSGTYVTYKFAHPPISHTKAGYDKRLLNSILKFIGRNEEEDAEFKQRMEAHMEDPASNPKPPNQNHYEMYLPENLDISEKFRGKFDLRNSHRDDESLNVSKAVSASGQPSFSFRWARSYLATVESEGSHDTKYNEEIAFAIDPNAKTAWYYPTMQRNRMEPPRRIYNADRHEKKPVDAYELTPEDPNEEFRSRMDKFQQMPQWNPDKEEEDTRQDDEAASQIEDGAPRRERSETPAANGRNSSEDRRVESEQDAEGDEED